MSELAGVRRLVRLGWRRDRLMAATWMGLIVAIVYASAAASATLYRTEADRIAAATGLDASPATVALYGPILDPHSLGELSMTKTTVLYGLVASLLFLFVVRRHTRGEEESGRAELVGGTAIGRGAPMAAAVVESVLLALALGALVAGADIAGGLPVGGSLLFGASYVGAGLFATGVAAVCCQLSASARTCAGVGIGVLGALYVVRAIGDVTDSWVRWLSPYGWMTQLRAWGSPRWWLLLAFVVLAVALLGVARVLRARRDLGAGLVAPRPGPAGGSPRLRDSLSLAWRTSASTVGWWTLAMLAGGLVMGAVGAGIGTILDSPQARRLIESIGGAGALQDTLLAAELSIAAVVVTCFAVAVVSRAGGDEHEGRTEQVLATGTSRTDVFGATVLVTLVGVLWLLLVTGVGAAVGFGSQQDGLSHVLGRLVPAALAQAPAAWVVAALTLLAFALRSRWAVAGWGLIAGFFALGQLGELLDLPEPVVGLSPYTHVPTLPGGSFEVLPTAVLTAVAAAATMAALVLYRGRDVG